MLDPGGADSFLRSVIGDDPPTVTAGGELRWSPGGLAFSAGVGLEITVPLDHAGPLHVTSLTLVLGAGTDGARLAATAVADLTLGPIRATVKGIGAALELAPRPGGGSFGGVAVDLLFVPPTGLGIEIDLGIGGGAGFVDHDPETRPLQRRLRRSSILGRRARRASDGGRHPGWPDDPDGWALFLSHLRRRSPGCRWGSASSSPASAASLCLNRAMDTEALGHGPEERRRRRGPLPRGPARGRRAHRLAQLDAPRRRRRGSTVLGLAVRITWGMPAPGHGGERRPCWSPSPKSTSRCSAASPWCCRTRRRPCWSSTWTSSASSTSRPASCR